LIVEPLDENTWGEELYEEESNEEFDRTTSKIEKSSKKKPRVYFFKDLSSLLFFDKIKQTTIFVYQKA